MSAAGSPSAKVANGILQWIDKEKRLNIPPQLQGSDIHLYADGSQTPADEFLGDADCTGWGIAIHGDDDWTDYHGPIIRDSSHPCFVPVGRGTNNVAELLAM